MQAKLPITITLFNGTITSKATYVLHFTYTGPDNEGNPRSELSISPTEPAESELPDVFSYQQPHLHPEENPDVLLAFSEELTRWLMRPSNPRSGYDLDAYEVLRGRLNDLLRTAIDDQADARAETESQYAYQRERAEHIHAELLGLTHKYNDLLDAFKALMQQLPYQTPQHNNQ